ncbi:MAG: flavin reductase family protein [Janthinobacterium lividum]
MAQVVNEREFKESLGRFPTGVSVISTVFNREPFGFTANSFASVSLKPPMVSFCLDSKAGSLKAFLQSDVFAVSILAENQEELSRHFSSGKHDKFSNTNYDLGAVTNCPLIHGAICYIECTKIHEFKGGDHIIFVGEVISTDIKNDFSPLVYFSHKYCGLK